MEFKNMYSILSKIRPRLPGAPRCTRKCSGTTQVATKDIEIKIPSRIERGPTDILKALSSTIKRDYTASNYKYHDDPFLIPSSNIGKRTFALAQESGRKAAQWVMAENPKLFNAKSADPQIPAFLPRVVFTDESQVTEKDLNLAIDEARVDEAVQIYEIMLKQKQTVSLEAKQSLLAFLCYFNSEETMPEDSIEERWFTNFQKRESRQRNSWNLVGMAHNVFDSIKEEVKEGPELVKAKCAILRGMAKYSQADKGWDLYQRMRSEGESIDVETYNQIIKLVGFVRDTIEKRMELLEELLEEMNRLKVRPDLGTLNAILQTITSSSGLHQTKTFALRVLAEFKELGIKPSLASYYHILNIFSRERTTRSGILEEIVTELEKEGAIQLRDPLDTQFFVAALDVCSNNLIDTALAKRIQKIVHTADNYNLIGDTYKESIYYRLLFTLMVKQEPLEDFMKLYHKFVPNIYIPEPSVMEEIIQSIDLHGAWEMLPTVWSDIVVFDQINRENLISNWLAAAVKANAVAPFESLESVEQSERKFYVSTEPEDPLVKMANSLFEAAQYYWTKIENQPKRYTNPIVWSGANLGCCLVLAIRANKYEFALKVLGKMNHEYIGAPPSIDALKIFLQRAIEEKDLDTAVSCVVFTADAGYAEAAMLAENLKKAAELTNAQLSKLNSSLGIM